VTELLPGEALSEETRPDDATPVDRTPAARVAGRGWLIFPRPNSEARTRLFCFPFAGGGAATFRPWADRLDPSIEVVAIEPPGRQTRIDEAPIRDMEHFVRDLVPELLPFLDKPFAAYGHCLGALTLFETVRALLRRGGAAPVHVFVSGARAPDELHRQQQFELNLLVRLCGLPNYDIFEPVHRQADDVFAEVLREFKILATDSFLSEPELRRLILPVIRAEFEMSSNYRFAPDGAWDMPITCLTGLHDTYVSAENAAAWSRFTTGRFELITVETDHFLVVEDDEVLIRVVNRELTHPRPSRADEV
jgi:surfactin synthase thioesterase subunit